MSNTTPLIESLAAEGALVCPVCTGRTWHLTPSTIRCNHCASTWPVRNQVPDFFNAYHALSDGVEPTTQPSSDTTLVDTLIEALHLPSDSATRKQVTAIARRAAVWTCASEAFTAEIQDLRDRFAPGPCEIRQPAPPANANRDPAWRLECHYLPSTRPANSRFSANVRVNNSGSHPWSSRVADGLVVAAYWLDAARRPIATDAATTAFPIDIAPGRSISLPLRLQAPPRAGDYRLRVQLQRLGQSEALGDSPEIPVTITPAQPGLLTRLSRVLRPGADEDLLIRQGPLIPDYAQDHQSAIALVESVLAARWPQRRARLLEVGSGTHPHLAWLEGYQLLALDISSPMLELGSLYFGERFRDRLGFICADAEAPPFAPASFDAVVMFSALHHFPAPERLLRRLVQLVKPKGFLGVLCEPVSDTLEHPQTIRELLKGINEQVFSIDEYLLIFARAGLRPEQIQVDGVSLKAILCPNVR